LAGFSRRAQAWNEVMVAGKAAANVATVVPPAAVGLTAGVCAVQAPGRATVAPATVE